MPPEATANRLEIRPYSAEDREFLDGIAQRLHPGQTASPREPDTLTRYFAELARGSLLREPGSEAFVATIDGVPSGVIAVHPDVDYFTNLPRAYVDILVVARQAEGKGVGRALMRHVEEWAREHGCVEVVLDVFAGNDAAIGFYERCGYRPDHIRMTKSVD